MTPRAWAPEEALLLRLCAAALADASGGSPAPLEVGPGVSWEALLRLADRHAVLPLVYRSLKTSGAVPDPHLAGLERRFRAIAIANLHAAGELVALVGDLRRQGVSVATLKGPALAQAAYGDVASRQFDDLDVLVRPSDAAAAAAVLAGRGFVAVGPGAAAFRSGDVAAWLARHYHQTFARGGDGMAVELHWRLMPDYFVFHVDVDAWLARPRQVALGQGTVPALSTEDQLLFLCAHGCKHVWERLSWVCDVAALIGRRGDVDWAALDAEAARIGGRRMLALGVALAHELLGVPVPAGIERAVRDDPQVPRLVGIVAADLFDASGNGRSHSIPLFLLRARERPRDRLHLLLHLVAGSLAALPGALGRRPVEGTGAPP